MYLCGSSPHPGGGVMGAPGANAAREVLRDLRHPAYSKVAVPSAQLDEDAMREQSLELGARS
jgi:hypothetical protein